MTHLDSLYIAYWSLRDPLTRSQSIPVVEALARDGYRMGLMTFEQGPWIQEPDQRRRSLEELAGKGIRWLPLPYHKRPRLLSTVIDVLSGALVARRAGARLLHGRGSVPAMVALLASRRPGARFFNDADGPLSSEYVDAGVWLRGSLGNRLTAWAEEWSLGLADASAVLTHARAGEIQAAGHPAPWVLPCCVDTSHFAPRPEQREHLRRTLGLEGRVFVYAGKLGGWYLVPEMFDFVAAFRRASGPASLLVLTTEARAPFEALGRARAVPCTVMTADRGDMPSLLSAADVGLSFILPAPSKRACSPVKNGEYLACGLPLVSTAGIGDYSDLIARTRIGVIAASLETPALEAAAREVDSLLAEPGLTARCRRVAVESLDLQQVLLPLYRDLYRGLLGPRAGARIGSRSGEGHPPLPPPHLTV